MKPVVATALVCLACTLSACHKDIQNQEAVRQGMLRYLAKRGDLSAMDVSIASVSFRSDEADAVVHFQSKNANGPGSGIDMKYVLVRNGSQWDVKGRAGGPARGANPHGDLGGAANPHGDMGAAPGALPPGHPPITPQPPASK